MERPQGSLAVLVLFVGRRYYLRPIIPWNAAAAPYPYSKMCELCELCELFVKKVLSLPKKSRQVYTIFPKKVDSFLKTLTLS